jgi:hypothetical protein
VKVERNEISSVGSIPGLDSLRLDSLRDFCERAKRLDSKVKESIRFKIRADFFTQIWAVCEQHLSAKILEKIAKSLKMLRFKLHCGRAFFACLRFHDAISTRMPQYYSIL